MIPFGLVVAITAAAIVLYQLVNDLLTIFVYIG